MATSGGPVALPSDDTDRSDFVLDPENDIATNELGDKLKVGVAGRKRFQRIYVRAPNGKKSTTSYLPANDGPAPDRTLSVTPTTEETEGRPGTMEFLVVGLVLAENPYRYSTKESKRARDKERDIARKARGILPAEPNVLRAIVPITEFIGQGSIKYYVACDQVMNICNMRVVRGDAIFYFAELVDGISSGADVKTRRAAIGSACKLNAAINKKPVQRAQTAIAKSQDLTPSNDLTVSKEENAANLLLIQYSLWTRSKSAEDLRGLQHVVEGILSEVTKRPANEGTIAFYDFGAALCREDVDKLIFELEQSYTQLCKLDPDLILGLHTILRKLDLGSQLPYQNLGLLMELAHDRITTMTDPHQLEQQVRQILKDIKIVNKIQYSSTVSTASNDDGNVMIFLASLREGMKEIQNFILARAKELREQHGGVQRHNSMDELIAKMGGCVDKTAMMALTEQALAIHAEQLAASNDDVVEFLAGLIKYIDQVLGGV